jgi:hypothetical protein
MGKKKTKGAASKTKKVLKILGKTGKKLIPGVGWALAADDLRKGQIPYLDDVADIYSAVVGSPEEDATYQDRKAQVKKSRKDMKQKKRNYEQSGNRARRYAKGGLVKGRAHTAGCGCATQGTTHKR